MLQFRAHMIHDAIKNASVQLQAWPSYDDCKSEEWYTVIALKNLHHPAVTVRVDAVFHVIAEGMEVQFGWGTQGGDVETFMQFSGRGRIDFSEVSGIHAVGLPSPLSEVKFRIIGEMKNPSPVILITLDLSKHQGVQ
jgi:hypothetical protein